MTGQPFNKYETTKHVDENGIRMCEWDTSFFSCLEHCIPNGCMALCLPCISLAQISARLGLHSFSLVFCGTFFLFVIQLWALLPFFIWYLRFEIRSRYRIDGSCWGDCLASCCCGCCTITQMATHVKSYQPGDCKFGPVDTLPPYSSV
jgi:Cys-rich protein (TIGR01571 family)